MSDYRTPSHAPIRVHAPHDAARSSDDHWITVYAIPGRWVVAEFAPDDVRFAEFTGADAEGRARRYAAGLAPENLTNI